ncbi:MAG: hypothetical protein ACHQUC_05215 [Chlamydiales bacterium]
MHSELKNRVDSQPGDSLYTYQPSPGYLEHSLNIAKHCLVAHELMSINIQQGTPTDQILGELSKRYTISSLPPYITFKNSESCLEIDFRSNRLITRFKGVQKVCTLSCALGIFEELSQIFASVERAKKEAPSSSSDQTLSSVEELYETVCDCAKASDDVQLSLGQGKINVYPKSKRFVVTYQKSQSSRPTEMLDGISHIFNKTFAQDICELLGTEPSTKGLRTSLFNIYLGRCILGSVWDKQIDYWGDVGKTRELNRIVSLIQFPSSAYYSEPIL